MNILESIRIALHSLAANKMRSILTMLGIIIGVAAVIALMGIGKGVQKSIDDEIMSMGTNLIFISPGAANVNGVRQKSGSSQTLTYNDAQALNDPVNAPAVAAVAPEISSYGQIVYQDNNINAQITGVTAEYDLVRNYVVDQGEFLAQANIDGRALVAVIGSSVANTLFEYEDPLGKQIRIDNIPFLVIGVLQSKGGMGMSFMDEVVFIPITTAMSRFSHSRSASGNLVSQISVQATDASVVDEAIEQITLILRERHHIGISEDDFTVNTQKELLNMSGSVTKALTLFLGAVAAISLLVGGIGIMNIMLVSVTERTREIGIRKSLGATRENILSQFLIEAIVLSMSGAVMGVILGALIAALISSIGQSSDMGIISVISMESVLLSTLFAIAIGVFFGIYPAYKAAALSPIDALHYE